MIPRYIKLNKTENLYVKSLERVTITNLKSIGISHHLNDGRNVNVHIYVIYDNKSSISMRNDETAIKD